MLSYKLFPLVPEKRTCGHTLCAQVDETTGTDQKRIGQEHLKAWLEKIGHVTSLGKRKIIINIYNMHVLYIYTIYIIDIEKRTCCLIFALKSQFKRSANV